MTKKIGRLHVITDESTQRRFTHAKLARCAVSGGAGIVQFRDKTMGTRELIETADILKKICVDAGIPLIINDRVDVAMAVDADGVHLGRDDIPIPAARRLLGSRKIIGGTAGSIESAQQAQNEGADYVGFGHIYPTQSKEKPSPAVGLGLLKEVCSLLDIPVIAIGGIDASNIGSVIQAGAFGAAVIGAVCTREDPEAAVAEIKDAIDRAVVLIEGSDEQ